MAMNGLSQSASDSMEPVARSSERCGARSKPFLMMSERMAIFDLRFSIGDLRDFYFGLNVTTKG
jgi:hypothetical protein